MKKGFSIIGAVIAVAIIAVLAIGTYFIIDGNNKATNFDNYNFYSYIEPDAHNGEIGDHIKGEKDAVVYIFEYADFQCPGCATMNTRVNQAVEELDGKLAVIYRNYLLSYHQNATAAASAAEAAGLQGYWKEYANALFSNQAEWEYASSSERTDLFNKYFTEITNGKGDLEKFKADIASERVSKKISFDMGIGKRIDIAGTPAFFVDGQRINWADEEGGEVYVNGKTISWDHALSGPEFVDILKQIVKASTSNN
ncbi:thioredoxin domain-containing protein [Candidatus Saccharibacteria bacterium]|nr:thioredoxin domain-containing protein [Candidatus Saccharibacteria bacterium]